MELQFPTGESYNFDLWLYNSNEEYSQYTLTVRNVMVFGRTNSCTCRVLRWRRLACALSFPLIQSTFDAARVKGTVRSESRQETSEQPRCRAQYVSDPATLRRRGQ